MGLGKIVIAYDRLADDLGFNSIEALSTSLNMTEFSVDKNIRRREYVIVGESPFFIDSPNWEAYTVQLHNDVLKVIRISTETQGSMTRDKLLLFNSLDNDIRDLERTLISLEGIRNTNEDFHIGIGNGVHTVDSLILSEKTFDTVLSLMINETADLLAAKRVEFESI